MSKLDTSPKLMPYPTSYFLFDFNIINLIVVINSEKVGKCFENVGGK